ncbi:MAG: hypothetical protein WBE83_14450, partial [Candidatus Cybelea sp.]
LAQVSFRNEIREESGRAGVTAVAACPQVLETVEEAPTESWAIFVFQIALTKSKRDRAVGQTDECAYLLIAEPND